MIIDPNYKIFGEGDLEIRLQVALSLQDVFRPELIVDLSVSKGGKQWRPVNKGIVALFCREAHVGAARGLQANEGTVVIVRARLSQTLDQWKHERLLWVLAE